MQILGIDPGRKRIGLALSDEADGTLALPFRTVERGANDVEAARTVQAAIVDRTVTRVVVGLPLRLDGSEGEAARRVRRFIAALEKTLQLPVHVIDERLTTLSAERGLREMGVRAERRREVVDQSAAAIILQTFLDSRTSSEE